MKAYSKRNLLKKKPISFTINKLNQQNKRSFQTFNSMQQFTPQISHKHVALEEIPSLQESLQNKKRLPKIISRKNLPERNQETMQNNSDINKKKIKKIVRRIF